MAKTAAANELRIRELNQEAQQALALVDAKEDGAAVEISRRRAEQTAHAVRLAREIAGEILYRLRPSGEPA